MFAFVAFDLVLQY